MTFSFFGPFGVCVPYDMFAIYEFHNHPRLGDSEIFWATSTNDTESWCGAVGAGSGEPDESVPFIRLWHGLHIDEEPASLTPALPLCINKEQLGAKETWVPN